MKRGRRRHLAVASLAGKTDRGQNRQAKVFFFQAEDGIRDVAVTGVQTCALPIYTTGPCARTQGPVVSQSAGDFRTRSLPRTLLSPLNGRSGGGFSIRESHTSYPLRDSPRARTNGSGLRIASLFTR